jgi:hypothetical protein
MRHSGFGSAFGHALVTPGLLQQLAFRLLRMFTVVIAWASSATS